MLTRTVSRAACRARAPVRALATPAARTIPIPVSSSVGSYVLENAASHGSKAAVIDSVSGRVTTYQELLLRVSAAMDMLRERGVKPGTVVALHLANSPEFIVAWHAIAGLGAIATTSNPAYTPTELAHQLRTARATLAVTSSSLLPAVKAAAAESGCVREILVVGEGAGRALLDDAPAGTSLPRFDLPAGARPSETTVVLPFSSGTTGLPKGVVLTHQNLVANVAQVTAHPDVHLDLGCDDVVAGILPLYHIYGMTVVSLTALRQGATIVTFPKFDPGAFLAALQRHRVSFLPLVPPIINFLARHPVVDQFDLSSARVIFSGAAPLDRDTQAAVEKRLKTSCRQGYGLTESSPVTHVAFPGNAVAGSIGQPVPNTTCRIVDPDTGADVTGTGPGSVGELWIRGPQVMKGYLNDPVATQNTLTKDGYLRTGDMAHVDADGNYFIVDRLKELLKVKGLQAAPAELEGVLLQHPLVFDAAVVGRPDPRAGELPVAFVVTKKRALAASNAAAAASVPEPTEEDVKRHVAGKLSEHKHLAEVRFVDAIPKSASGKILRRVLKEQVLAGMKAGAKA